MTAFDMAAHNDNALPRETETNIVRSALHNSMPDLARSLCGDPNRLMSNRSEWRFGKFGSLSVVIAGRKVGSWYDHEAGTGGGVFDLISHRFNLSFREALEWATRFVGSCAEVGYAPQPAKLPEAANDNRKAIAARVWAEAVDPRGTIVEAYLKSRKLPLCADIAGETIRFHSALAYEGRRVAGMVALMRDIHNNEPCGIHRTFLGPDGQKLSKKMLGRAKDAAIKLSADEYVTNGLHVGEGIETCLSWMRLGFAPTWALGSAGAIASLPVLAGIDALTILMETDAASERASEACRIRWLQHGREVSAVKPVIQGDGNDVLKMVA